MSSSKVILICLALAVLVAAASANECAAAAQDYVRDYNKRRGQANRLEEISSCAGVANDPNVYWMSLIMVDFKDHYTSCLDIQVKNGRVVNQGTCY